MWHLLKKDFKLCRLGIFALVVLHFFLGPISIIFLDILTGPSIYSMIPLVFHLYWGLILTVGVSLGREKKVNGENILYSLPVDKGLLITSRYISSAILPIIQSLIYLLYSYISVWTDGFAFMGITYYGERQVISIFNIMGALALVFPTLGILLYNHFTDPDKEGKKNKRLASIIYTSILIVAMLAISKWDLIKNSGIIEFISQLRRETVLTVGFISSIIIYIISLKQVKKRILWD